jgi:hypothetical protein
MIYEAQYHVPERKYYRSTKILYRSNFFLGSVMSKIQPEPSDRYTLIVGSIKENCKIFFGK